MVPQLEDLREEILKEFHCAHFAVHPSGMKMYHDLVSLRFCSMHSIVDLIIKMKI